MSFQTFQNGLSGARPDAPTDEDVLVRSKRLRRSTVAAVSGLVICQKIVGRYGAELGGVGVWAGIDVPLYDSCITKV